MANAHVACTFTGADFLAVFIVDYRVDTRHGRAGAARLHVVDGRYRAAQEPAIFRLPPSVYNGRLAFADDVVVPAPGLGLDGFADRGHEFEVEVVFGRLIGADPA